MNRVCLVNGSLRGKAAASLRFLNRIEKSLAGPEFHIDRVTLKAGGQTVCPRAALETIAEADALIIAFPLFSYTLPGALTALLEEFYSRSRDGGQYNRRAKVYAVINCGFPDPRINGEAIRVIRNFCARLGLSYRFSVAIGSGPAAVVTMRVPFLNPRLKRAFTGIAKDIPSDGTAPEDVYIRPIIPKAVLLGIKKYVENKSASFTAAETRQE